MRLQPSSLALGLLLTACGAAPQIGQSAASSGAKAVAHAKRAPAAATEAAPAASPVEAATPSYAVGDYLVRVFTLPSRARVTVSERVVAVKDSSVVLEITREDGHKSRSIRVELDESPGRRGEVLSASVLRAGVEVPMGRAVYDALMSGTAFAADENEGQIESGSAKLDVRGHEVDCNETRFRVKVRGKEATMRTLELVNSPWGEVAAEVKTAQGRVLYRAEVVDVGHDELRTAAVSGD
jgi:hypothetical protein